MMPDSPANGILVVVPTLNEAVTIEAVIRTLLADPPQGRTVRLVVADGGSTDSTQDIVQRMAVEDSRIHLLHNPKRLQSAGINRAVSAFGSDVDTVVRCDAHAVYPDRFIARLIESLDRNGADAVVVPMDSIGDTCVRRGIAWVSDTRVGSGGSAHRGGRTSGFVDHGHHAAFRLQSFARAGGYDESFSHNEDAELDCRQRALGSRIYLDADIRLGYYPRSSLSSLWRQYFGYGRGRSRTVRRHPASLRLRQFAVPTHISICVLCLLASALTPWTLLWPLAYVAALLLTSLSVAVRRRSVCGLLAGPAAFVMHASWAAGFFNGLLTLRETRWHASTARPLQPPASPA